MIIRTLIMESRIHLDQLADIPLSLIDFAPWNPKTDICGSYREGLEESLSFFGNRDRLKVWPNPERKGRYFAIDGNQRRRVVFDWILTDKIRGHFQIAKDCTLKDFNKIRNDPDNIKAIDKLRKSVDSYKVPCQVITKLDENTKFTLTHAKQFTAAYNRNYAKYDEVKQAELHREILAERLVEATETNSKVIESSIKRMLRPELPVVPASALPSPTPVQTAFQFDAPGEFTPTKENPWGSNPPTPQSDGSSVSTIQLVPLVFSLTPEGYKSITDTVLRSKSRVFREDKLKAALEKLEKIVPNSLDGIIDSTVVETALSILNKHIEVSEQK